ncbi:MAG: prephenate dehydratase [Rhodospirillales bacterium]|nr:prephenate dehydratase [Rhodospirillales bacterium]MBO6787905.1 prephenate dehydratase [Rhodospirillales bacterium]
MTSPDDLPDNLIAFQGAPGANSDIACRTAYPDMTSVPCNTFNDAFAAVQNGDVKLAMIPIDNTVAGRVADIHHLLPESGLHIIGEHFERINHQLLALPGTDISEIKEVHSHVHALNQCRGLIRELGVKAVVHADTAGAASDVAKWGDKTKASISSRLAAEVYGLEILRSDIEDAEHNTTRFVILSREASWPAPGAGDLITSFVFRVRNIPAALYKAMGGFATNGVNMTKLESYVGEGFVVAQFYAEVEGHPEDTSLKLALEELNFFSDEVKILGVYPANPYRKTAVTE